MSKDSSTPPEIANGSFVSWDGGKGRVDLIVTNGTVPGVADSDIKGSSDSPAARVVVWKDGAATREKIAASCHTLKRIAPLGESKVGDDLVALHTLHQQAVEDGILPEHAALSASGVKTAYDRGVASWPGYGETTLSPQEWGAGRAEHLIKAAAGMVDKTRDSDLLTEGHPNATTPAPNSRPGPTFDLSEGAPVVDTYAAANDTTTGHSAVTAADEPPVADTPAAPAEPTDAPADDETVTLSPEDVQAQIAALTAPNTDDAAT